MNLPRELVYHILTEYIPSEKVRLQREYYKQVISDIKFLGNEPPLKWFWRQPNIFKKVTYLSTRPSHFHPEYNLVYNQNVFDYLLRSKDVVF